MQPEPLTILQRAAALADPHVCSDDKDRLSILAAVYEPLARRGPGGAFTPCLAEGWSLSPDARTWRFALRGGVHCHNGDLLEARDVVASLERVCDPAMGGELGTQGVYRSYLAGAEIVPEGPLGLRITTREPLADLLDILVELPVVPRGALASLGAAPVGSGPYRVVAASDGVVEMQAFDGYWGGAPAARALRWRAEPRAAARAAALLAGEADLVCALDAEGRRLLSGGGPCSVLTRGGSTCVILMCRMDAGPCADRRVRQALNYGVDVGALIAALHGGAAAPLAGPLTALHFGADPAVAPYPHDPGKARALLAAAGYADGLELTLDAPTVLPDEAPALAELVRAQLAEAGVRLRVRLHADRPGYAEMVRAKGIGDLCVFDSSPLSSFRVLREKFHSGLAGPWWLGYSSAEVDRLIDAAQATPEPEARRELYRQSFARIHEDAPWVFLYSPELAWGAGPRLAGWRPAPDGLVRPWAAPGAESAGA
jgi:peptide/nickel transport system substrate-binding protein